MRVGPDQVKMDNASPKSMFALAEMIKHQSKNSVEKKIYSENVVLNVGGMRYETHSSTLRRIQGTRLSALSRDDENFDKEQQEYFFDRHPALFPYILNFYRTGELHLPTNECGPSVKNELEYWKLNEGDISTCCWLNYSRYKEYSQLKEFDDLLNTGAKSEEAIFRTQLNEEKLHCLQRIRKSIWFALEYPHRSYLGRVLAFISLLFVIVSILNIVLMTYRPWYVNTIYEFDNKTQNYKLKNGTPHPYFEISDYVCVAYFTFEFISSFVLSENKLKLLKSIFMWSDFLALAAYYTQIVLISIDDSYQCLGKNACNNIALIRYIQLFRILRIGKIFKNYSSLRVLAYTFKSSLKELFIIITLVMCCVLVFACLIFFLEEDQDTDRFTSIPIAFWFSLITMTTVGYGDILPVTTAGYFVASLCAICGVLLIAFTVPIAVNNFATFYNHAQSRLKHPNLKKSEWKMRKT